ncbi:disintegrin and metallo ase domain-containing 12-like protein [Labeo rohita]|uniref:Disintegrin and metallo ase domain-containing 12-like protein n=3 Tax=Labeonini TaxID=2743697 RepID=A0A498MMV7_LABRO|nr:disintegrin and metallo ase domain-containing 12-like protein [Labeo rohita]
MPDRPPSLLARSENKTLQSIAGTPVPSRHKTVVVTVTENRERHCASETPSSPQAPPVYEHSYTEEEDQTDSLKRPIFRSCAHLELPPSKLSRSTLYLDKSLTIPLGQTLYRSTLSLSLGKPSFTQTPEKPQTMGQTKRSYSDWDMANVGVDGTERLSQELKNGSTVNGSGFKNNTGSGSDTQCSTLTSLPFRTRCHSSSAAFRLNGKANDVLGPPQSNLRARQAFSGPSVHEWVSRDGMKSVKSEALELFRPDFISRSLNRVRRLELRARERRSFQTAEFIMGVETANRRQNCTKPHPLSDNLFKPRDRAISGKEMQWRSRRSHHKEPGIMRIYRRMENWCLMSGLRAFVLLIVGLTGDIAAHQSPDGRQLKSVLNKLEHYHTMVPLLLEGTEQRPISWLRSRTPPASLRILIQAGEQQLILSMEKNHGLFANHYTETHYKEDGQTVMSAHNSTHKRDVQKTTKYVELIIVADNREFQKQGKDVEKVKQRLAEIANYVDKFYRVLNIRVALVGLEVWSDADKCAVTQDPFTTLHEFLDWRKLKLLPQRPHDNAQLISGVYFQGTTIGMAPIMSMCTAEQSGGIVMDHSDNPLGAAVTLAHELGHNFGMNHDTPERGCGCRMTVDRGGCIMTPSTGYPFPTVFSTCSKKDLVASLEKGVGMCLYNMPEVKMLYGGQKCGNGYIEEGEECDCGELELKPAGTPCRESSNSCDLPEFCTGTNPHCPANVYLHDGHACHNMDGYCYNGICQTHEQQCITLWGPGAKPAPGICFERVNSAGDPYGNCGKDSKGSFAKCQARDARCGKIQCQGGANRPVIGTNAVSIETNIPLQEGGRILCRGTHVYLGDDMPDPGLVLAGTKCAEGMECNNKKNCHCEAHWAPPFCDRAGFGGSIDSGPMRQAADSSAVAVGALVTLLCLLSAGLIVCLKRKALVQMLCINKKSAIQKLRSVGRKRAPSPPQTQSVFRVSPQHKPASLPLHSRCDKTSHPSSEPLLPPHNFHSLRRLPECPTRCQPVHISHPMPITGLQPLPSVPLHRTLMSHTHSPGRTAGFHTLPRQLPYANIQDHDKPSPPQKPLPADPLIRGHGVGQSSSAVGVRIPGPLAIPIPTVPRPPPAIPLPNRPLPRLPQPFYDH